ncbi:MAG TPA: proline racemase family protein [Chloroflexia bacterium]|nr:proline racemase family protein [Chloroflexia bacterium]
MAVRSKKSDAQTESQPGKFQLNWNRRDITKQDGVTVITTLDSHTGGEPLRVVTGGMPELPGATILERRRYMMEHLDHIRKALMWEPRGHYDMYGAIVTPPVTPEADLGVLFMHNEGYSTMCGHGIIALVTVLLETGAIEPKGPLTPVNLDTPAGLVRATAHYDAAARRVTKVSFLNVPSFVYARDVKIKGRLLGQHNKMKVDVAYGGAFYAIAPIERLGYERLEDVPVSRLVKLGASIKSAFNSEHTLEHPFEPDLSFLYGTILVGPPRNPAHHSANICVFADREVDRSPTGTGVSARLALLSAKGEIAPSGSVAIESIIGSVFEGRVAEKTRVGKFEAIVPEVSGSAFITGRNEYIIDPRDPFGAGFLVR